MYMCFATAYPGRFGHAPDGKFSGYFGANRVELTVELVADMIWRRFMTDEQRKKMKKYIPLEYHNFCISDDGFIYMHRSVVERGKPDTKTKSQRN